MLSKRSCRHRCSFFRLQTRKFNYSTSNGGSPKPDSKGTKGSPISLCLIQSDPSQEKFYDVDISPRPSKEFTSLIEDKLVQDNSDILFQEDCQDLSKYLKEEEYVVSLPQNHLQALDVVLGDSSTENCFQVGKCVYSTCMGGVKDIGRDVVGLRGFFKSFSPTQQDCALNLASFVMPFHDSIGFISYILKRCDFLNNLLLRKIRGLTIEGLTIEEKREVGKIEASHVKYRTYTARHHVMVHLRQKSLPVRTCNKF